MAGWSDLRLAARVFLVCVWIAGLSLVLWGALNLAWSPRQVGIILLFAGSVYFMDLFPIPLRQGESTLSVSVHIAATMLLPPPAIPLVASLGTALAEMRFRRTWYKAAFNVGQMVIGYTALAWGFHYIADGDPLMLNSTRDVATIAFLSVGNYMLNVGLVALAISLASGVPVISVWRGNDRDVVLHQIARVPLGILLAFVMQHQPLAVVLLLPPLFILRQAFEQTADLRRRTVEALMALASSIDSRDPSTFEHSQRVGELARAIARAMGLPPDEVETIHLSARVHDLGKVGVPDAILFKAGELSEEEYQTIKEHPVISARIVESFPLFRAGHDIIKHHHERYRGGGYPAGIAAETIPLGARIIAVADAYDAMTSDRPYRAGLPREVALHRIAAESASQFDPEVVKAFLRVMGALPQRRYLEQQDDPGTPVTRAMLPEVSPSTNGRSQANARLRVAR